MPTKLEEIIAATRERVSAAKSAADHEQLTAGAARHQPRGFRANLQRVSLSGAAVIAELKKASPSKGLIRADFRVADLAVELEHAGAAALSVLTDEQFFQGSLRNLELASASTAIPCLRKDFMVDEYQIVEARAHHADAILLIAAALTDSELCRYSQAAHSLSLDVLVEVHTAAELDRVLATLGVSGGLGESGADAIGVNNRDLKTFAVNLETSLELAERIPPAVVRVAESGIAAPGDLARLRAAGFDAFLIGESLMREPDPGAALKALLAAAVTP